jgi:diaminohydroxyphosphoribosylaminopyrimidine deaminase / 5-amino-6-(5-phosphoribosylamino)uracil reductase
MLKMWNDQEVNRINRAFELSKRGKGRTAPRPAVGAVVVNANGEIVGEGWTQPDGGSHAEFVALEQAGDRARGGTIFCTLEPCFEVNLRHNGEPRCAKAILNAGIKRVFYAVRDPNPLVANGAKWLNENGVAVFEGTPEIQTRAEANLEGFLKWVRTNRPLVILKYAMTLDGKIATRTGHSRWIAGEESRLETHRLRDESDAILVGADTVIKDNPALTTRLPAEEVARRGYAVHHPLRIVLDSSGRIPLTADVLANQPEIPTLYVTTAQISRQKLAEVENTGVEVLVLPVDDTKRVSLPDLVAELGRRGLHQLMVEGGGQIHASFIEQKLADKAWAFIAPKIVGGSTAPNPVGGQGVEFMHQAAELNRVTLHSFGQDILVKGYFAV